MSELTCPVKRWPGTIRLPDYLNFRLEREWERAIEEIGASEEARGALESLGACFWLGFFLTNGV